MGVNVMPRRDVGVEPLMKRLVAAFADVPKPPDSEIAPHPCLECDELRRAFAPYESLDVPDAVVKEHCDALPLFSAPALRYFLIAYLRCAMRDPTTDVFQYLLFHLSPTLKQLADDYHRERVEIFSKSERSALCAYLEWAESADDEKGFTDEIARARQVWCVGA